MDQAARFKRSTQMRVRRRTWLSVPAAVGVVALIAPALARAAFDPAVEIRPSTLKAGANPRIDFSFVQDAGEEPIASLTFLLPRAFRFPRDASIAAGEHLGRGQLTTAIGPVCSDAVQETFPATLVERDRVPAEIEDGVRTVWVADLGPID